MSAASPRRLTGRHVLAIVVAFFTVIIGVNAVFAWFAIGTHPGSQDADAYRHGLAYNDTLDRAASQRALGWRVSIEVVDGRELVVIATGRDGLPLAGLAAAATLRRPARADGDRTLALVEREPGRYATAPRGIADGRWDVEVVFPAPDGEAFRLERRVWIGTK